MTLRTSLISTALVALAFPALALAGQTSVSLGVNSISPASVTVNSGDTVVWTNTSSSNQSVTANAGSFQSGYIAPGKSFAATFNSPGTYNYYDNASGYAVLGTVTVVNTGVSSNAIIPSTSGASNPSSAALSGQVQSLIAEIDSLQAQLGQSGGTYAGGSTGAVSGSCPSITRTLSPGSSGADVSALQQFLAQNPSIYPEGLVTGYYGTLTEEAVARFQTTQGIVTSGNPATTGYGQVGPRTAAAIAAACASGSGAGAGAGSGTVSGFIQVSPVAGPAPLTVSVVATINTALSCQSTDYVLNFGDGSQSLSIPSNGCSQENQTFQHTYQAPGTYQVVLAAGSHESTATVTVSGTTQPQQTQTQTTQPSGTISAFVTSGPAPFATTFYISCASGLAYDVVFGDGSDLGGNGVSQSSCNGSLQSVAHTYKSAGSYTAQLVIFYRDSQGNAVSKAVTNQAITVTDPLPTTFTVTPTSGIAPLAVEFNLPESFDGNTIDFGDGSTQLLPIPDEMCTNGATCSPPASWAIEPQGHTYTTPGTYTATIVDPSGNTLATAGTVTVSGPVSYTPPSLTPEQNNPLAEELTFQAELCGDGYSVEWGDGSHASSTCASGGDASTLTTETLDHTYAEAGTYTITLTRGSRVDPVLAVIEI